MKLYTITYDVKNPQQYVQINVPEYSNFSVGFRFANHEMDAKYDVNLSEYNKLYKKNSGGFDWDKFINPSGYSSEYNKDYNFTQCYNFKVKDVGKKQYVFLIEKTEPYNKINSTVILEINVVKSSVYDVDYCYPDGINYKWTEKVYNDWGEEEKEIEVETYFGSYGSYIARSEEKFIDDWGSEQIQFKYSGMLEVGTIDADFIACDDLYVENFSLPELYISELWAENGAFNNLRSSAIIADNVCGIYGWQSENDWGASYIPIVGFEYNYDLGMAVIVFNNGDKYSDYPGENEYYAPRTIIVDGEEITVLAKVDFGGEP